MRREHAPGSATVAAAGTAPWPAPHPYGNERLWLDCLIEREILRLRARYQLSLDELRGLYVSDRQVDDLLRAQYAGEAAAMEGGDPVAALSAQASQWRLHFSHETPLALLGRRLGLGTRELDLLLVILAPELDLRYETLYAYLNNDITRRHASIDLASRLLAPGGEGVRAHAQALTAQGILDPPNPSDPAEHRSTLGLALRLARPVRDFLLGQLPVELAGGPAGWRFETGAIDGRMPAEGPAELLVCRGEDEERLGGWASGQLAMRGRHGLHLTLPASGDPVLPARLAGAVLVLHEPAAPRDSPEPPAAMLARARAGGVDTLWLTSRGWQPDAACGALGPGIVDLPPLTVAERTADWRRALAACPVDGAALQADSLAARFGFGPTRIRQVIAGARALAATQGLDSPVAVERAARQLAAQPLARVARHATRAHTWDQLVLPATTLALLREAAAAIACRQRVYRDWNMQGRTGRSAGLMLLFSGASGTGKTMAASVLANHVGFDLYRVDLAGVVSKYIGETEKNLDQIFHTAADADALLLFDEADALLGKRAEVKDAHDRYANIEVAYLLQKMEDHDGVVILASNLPKNLDQAFSRRMHYVVEFSRPGPALREQLWRAIYPRQVPLDPGIDYPFLAQQFDLTGGDIQTIALEAAFLAADSGCAVGMPQLLRALARRQTKHGDPGVAARYRSHQGSVDPEAP